MLPDTKETIKILRQFYPSLAIAAGPQPPADTPVATPSSVAPQATGNGPNDAETAALPKAGENEQPAKTPYELPFPQWIFSLTGHVVFALAGLGLGYLVLCWLRPDTFRLPW